MAAVGRMTRSDEWKRELQRNYREGSYMTSVDSSRSLEAQYDEYRHVLADVGLAK
jgi:tripartite-type tricarboxylate transporter receptor subunit TctC